MEENHRKMKKRILWHLPLAVVFIVMGLNAGPKWSRASTSNLPDWLEPRGLSIIELVGQVPESYLHGTIISYGPGNGIVVYESGTRNGNTVVVTTTIYPRFSTPSWAPNQMLTYFGSLGQEPHYDHMASAVPHSVLRVYNGGVEVTSQIEFMFLTQMVNGQPATNSTQWYRYPRFAYGQGQTYPLPMTPDGLYIPPNSGCEIWIPGQNYASLTGVFTLTLDAPINASVVGTQTSPFQSYIGPGDVGIFQPLMQQLKARYGNRNTRVPLSIPAGADYFLLKFPPMPGDAYSGVLNARRPAGGTYRLARPTSQNILSTDYVFSAAFPINVFWRDADQAPGSAYLPAIHEPIELEAPEYVLPAGVAYDDCYTRGDCSAAKLQQIYDATMPLEIIYLSVSKSPIGMQWTPLRMAGPVWSPSAAASSLATLPPLEQPAKLNGAPDKVPSASVTSKYIYFPLIFNPVLDEPSGCPCGWFDDLGRMVDYVPGP
jgi:hypothetical protein